MAPTEHRTFERLVRTRMEKTDERYAAARSALLTPGSGDEAVGVPVLPSSDAAVERATGRGWEAWIDLLDDSGASERPHAEIAAWLVEEHGVDAWWAQNVTVGYERARGGRAVGEMRDGFQIGASKTVAAAAERAFDAFVDPEARARWLPVGDLRERTATRPKSARFDWEDGRTRVHLYVTAKGATKTSVTVNHERLADAEEAARMKANWRAWLVAFKDEVEG